MIEFLAQTGSTNADLAARLRGGEHVAEGCWLVAGRQTAGRGRRGREWLDGFGNFMGSTLVNLRPGDPAPQTLALMCGLVVQQAVSTSLPDDVRAVLKWPNDVMIGTAKVAGILLEREGDAVIVGIGVNLASAPSLADRETVALSAFGTPPGRDTFAEELARLLAAELDRWRSFGIVPIVDRWLAAAHAPGTPLHVSDAGGEALEGSFAGLTADGSLQLRLADGRTREIRAGEVQFVRSS